MKVIVEYKDEAEKVKFLENVKFLLKDKTEKLEEIADAFTQHLMLVAKDAYVQGGVRREAEAKAREISAEADTLLGGDGDAKKE